MQRFDDPIPGTDNLIHLPVRVQVLTLDAAAAHLGTTGRRLRLLQIVGGGPARDGEGAYRIEALDAYIADLYTRAGIGPQERARHRLEYHRAGRDRLAVARAGVTHRYTPDAPLSDAESFMRLATGRELERNGIFFLLKAMALFGLIMLCLSSTPLLKTHFG